MNLFNVYEVFEECLIAFKNFVVLQVVPVLYCFMPSNSFEYPKIRNSLKSLKYHQPLLMKLSLMKCNEVLPKGHYGV